MPSDTITSKKYKSARFSQGWDFHFRTLTDLMKKNLLSAILLLCFLGAVLLVRSVSVLSRLLLAPAAPSRRLLPFEVGGPFERRSSVRHSITHRRIEVVPVVVRTGYPTEPPRGWVWAHPAQPELPTSSLLAKLLRAAGK